MMKTNPKKNTVLRVVWSSPRKKKARANNLKLPDALESQYKRIAEQYNRIAELENRITNRFTTLKII